MLMATVAVGCSAPTSPGGIKAAKQVTANLIIASEDCSEGDCHADSVTYSAGDDIYTDMPLCEGGCTTYPLGSLTRAKVEAALRHVDVRADPICQDLYNVAVEYLETGKIRWWPTDLNNGVEVHGDAHWGWLVRNEIHLGVSNFTSRTNYEVGKTVMHETYHIFRNTTNNIDAKAAADLCVGPNEQ
jgi:hypothetical protein